MIPVHVSPQEIAGTYLTMKELCAYAKTSRAVVYRMLKENKLKAYRFDNLNLLFKRSEIDALIESQEWHPKGETETP